MRRYALVHLRIGGVDRFVLVADDVAGVSEFEERETVQLAQELARDLVDANDFARALIYEKPQAQNVANAKLAIAGGAGQTLLELRVI